jgi:hypothetical protein
VRIPNTNDGYGFLGYLQDALSKAIPTDASRLKGDAHLLAKFLPAGSLKSQIETATEGTELPHSLSFDTSSIVDHLTLVHSTHSTEFFSKLANEFANVGEEIKSLVLSPTPENAKRLIEGFFGRDVAVFQDLWWAIQPFASNQFAIGLSLVSTLKNLLKPDLLKSILTAYSQYFFADGGYQTVDGMQIAAPVQWGNLASDHASLKGYLSQKTGVAYLRDLIDLTVDAAGDVQYDLRKRYNRIATDTRLTAAQKRVAARWFKGFGAMAEGAVTSSVEEVVSGVASFQLNPLIAAAAGTYAGTVARKATQHVFLLEVS